MTKEASPSTEASSEPKAKKTLAKKGELGGSMKDLKARIDELHDFKDIKNTSGLKKPEKTIEQLWPQEFRKSNSL